MIFVYGPLGSGKTAAAAQILGCAEAELEGRCLWDVQDLAAEETDLEVLAARLSAHEVLIATEQGAGVIPADPETRRAREAAGRLCCLLAARAEAVYRVCCGIPLCLKGEER